jgi:cytochrome c oxidase subunit III
MWVFLCTEILFFGGVLSAFALFERYHHTEFEAASHHLNVLLGAINTAVLLVSSLTMAFAVHYATLRDRAKTIRNLLFTLLFGSIFLGIKAIEWTTDWREGFIPGWNWTSPKILYPREAIFWSFYFTLTGLHALHMVIGVAILIVILVLLRRGWFTGTGATQIEMFGLYWHFVDIAWVFLFPILYLINR